MGTSRRQTRLRDIAAKTGFSTNTVSLALRNSERLPEKTRQIIHNTAKELNYLPNLVAQSLKNAQSHVIGLILTDVKNPVLTEMAKATGDLLHDKGYATLFTTSGNDPEREDEVLRTFRARQVDGILVFPVHHARQESLISLRAMNFPIVSFAGQKDCGLDVVGLSEFAGAAMAAEYILSKGHQNVAVLDAASPMGNTEKWNGFKSVDGLSEINVHHQPVLGHSATHGYETMEALWTKGLRPTAVFASSDAVALGVLRWCFESKLRVPEDIAIVGFDDTDFARDALVPITSVHFPVHEVAAAAIDRLLNLIENRDAMPTPTQTLIAPELTIRSSS